MTDDNGFETDSDVERLVDQVIQEPLEEIHVAEDFNDSSDEEMEYNMVDPYDLLEAMGVEAFLEEQRALEVRPEEIYEAFELSVPSDTSLDLWVRLKDELQDVYLSMFYCSDSDECVSEMPPEDGEENIEEDQEKIERAKAFLLELRQKGPLQFVEDHELVGTSAAFFLSTIGRSLPKPLILCDHKDQWAFVKRFLIKYVYQRPRIEDKYSFEHAVEAIKQAKRILIVTGAGISVSCGIPDFRTEHGLYASIKDRFDLAEPECMFDIEYFRIDPTPFYLLAKVPQYSQ